jgi:hypothetical protein
MTVAHFSATLARCLGGIEGPPVGRCVWLAPKGAPHSATHHGPELATVAATLAPRSATVGKVAGEGRSRLARALALPVSGGRHD